MTRANAPAFPTPDFYDERLIGTVTGMTLREHFAALAMQGMLAGDPPSLVPADGYRDAVTQDAQAIARFAVAHADALLAELAKP